MNAPRWNVDVAIIGFGFCGLATLANLVDRGGPKAVAIVADDLSGVGLAYATPEPGHLLNVAAKRMGALASDPGGFADWLVSGAAGRACAELGVRIPGPDDFAPRAIYGSYLRALRARTVRRARARGVRLQWIHGRADGITRTAQGRWQLNAGSTSIVADHVVLATGTETRSDFRPVTHAGLPDLIARPPGDDGRPALIIGTGLTAVDALITLRAGGFRAPVIAVSRTGLLPRAHRPGITAAVLRPESVADLRDVSAVVRFIRAGDAAEDWRCRLDALRPHTSAIWQRLTPASQASAARRWGTYWSVHRHRMAPENAILVEAELTAGTLRTLQISSIVAQALPGQGIAVTVTPRQGPQQRLEVAALVDCTGSQLEVAASRQPLLRGLVGDELVTPHSTGRGLTTDDQHRVGDRLYALGSLLVGQLWESIAVPELRGQASTIAAAIGSATA